MTVRKTHLNPKKGPLLSCGNPCRDFSRLVFDQRPSGSSADFSEKLGEWKTSLVNFPGKGSTNGLPRSAPGSSPPGHPAITRPPTSAHIQLDGRVQYPARAVRALGVAENAVRRTARRACRSSGRSGRRFAARHRKPVRRRCRSRPLASSRTLGSPASIRRTPLLADRSPMLPRSVPSPTTPRLRVKCRDYSLMSTLVSTCII